MTDIHPDKVRNIVILGHGGAGKTTLAESMLFQAKVIHARGEVEKGTAAFVIEDEEKGRQTTITPHPGAFEWKDYRIHIVDTPGYFNFLEGNRPVLPAVDAAILLISGVSGVRPETDRLWMMLEEAGVPVIAFVNELDSEQADFTKIMTSLSDDLRKTTRAVALPMKNGAELEGTIDILKQKGWQEKDGKASETEVPAELQDQLESFRLELIESIAESEDELVEKYLEGEELSDEEINRGFKTSIKTGGFVPVYCGSALNNVGVSLLLDAITDYLPSHSDRLEARPFKGINPDKDGEEVECKGTADEPFSAYVFKSTIDPFSGKLSFVRVCSGSVKNNDTLYNANNREKEKTGHVFKLVGAELKQAEELVAGEIGALSKMEKTSTCDSVCSTDSPIQYPVVELAKPGVMYAIQAEAKSEDKASAGLNKLVGEDPSLRFYREPSTREMILAGMGQGHIEVVLERLERKFGAKINLKVPKVPYRETIKKKVKVQGKLKKQTGGHGQFANCWIEVEPLAKGGDFEFADMITGGIIPRQYIPSVEKGVQDSMQKGVLAGFPVVDVKVSLVDGSFHTVDSSDFAFQTAGSMAFKTAMEEAQSVLLEPIMTMEIVVPEDLTGDIIKDLSGRRGKVLGMTTKKGKQTINAEVPMPEVLEYGNMLSALTSGQGAYSMSISGYSEMPSQIAEKLLEEAKKADEKKE